MIVAFILLLVALVLVVGVLLWVLHDERGESRNEREKAQLRVDSLTKRLLDNAKDTMVDARELSRQVSTDNAFSAKKVLEALSEATGRQAADMMQMAKTAWAPSWPGESGTPVSGDTNGTHGTQGGQRPSEHLTAIYATATSDDERDPTDLLEVGGDGGTGGVGGVMGQALGARMVMDWEVDPETGEEGPNPFNIPGLHVPTVEELFGPMKDNGGR